MPETPHQFVDRVADEMDAWTEKNIADGGVCDFCCHLLTGKQVVTYTTTKPLIERMVLIADGEEATLDHVNDEYWAACPDCDPVIQQGDPAALAEHVAATVDTDRLGFQPDAGEAARLTVLYKRFFDAEPSRSLDPPPDNTEH